MSSCHEASSKFENSAKFELSVTDTFEKNGIQISSQCKQNMAEIVWIKKKLK